MDRVEAIMLLDESKSALKKAETKDGALAIIKNTGMKVGYKPAFRCLLMGMSPEQSIQWKEE